MRHQDSNIPPTVVFDDYEDPLDQALWDKVCGYPLGVDGGCMPVDNYINCHRNKGRVKGLYHLGTSIKVCAGVATSAAIGCALIWQFVGGATGQVVRATGLLLCFVSLVLGVLSGFTGEYHD